MIQQRDGGGTQLGPEVGGSCSSECNYRVAAQQQLQVAINQQEQTRERAFSACTGETLTRLNVTVFQRTPGSP